MRPQALALITALTLTTATTAVADEAAGRPVDLALVLLTDVSNSMDDREYEMVKDGYKAAFSDPQVVDAITSNSQGVAIAYVEFSSIGDFVVVKGWDVLTDAASARSFGNAVAGAPRTSSGNTELAPSIKEAAAMLEDSDFGAARRVIDVASDHPNDNGRSANVRDAVVAAGITINALPIVDDRVIGTFDGHMSYTSARSGFWSPAEFYRRDVIGGTGSFLIEARDYSAFGEALKRKLLRELISSPDPVGSTGGLAAAD